MAMKDILLKFWRDEEGGESVEYVIVVGLLVVFAAGTIQLVGGGINNVFNLINSYIGVVTG